MCIRDSLPPAVKVRTFKSTDEGVAFMVECEGKRIYHAGDLNNWVWRGEPEADNARMSDRYHRELDEMAGNQDVYKRQLHGTLHKYAVHERDPVVREPGGPGGQKSLHVRELPALKAL